MTHRTGKLSSVTRITESYDSLSLSWLTRCHLVAMLKVLLLLLMALKYLMDQKLSL